MSQEKSKSLDLLFSIQSEGLVWNYPQGAWNPSQSDGMAYSLLAHRLHGGTSCYVPSLTERSRSNLHSLADKQACRLASLDYHASACILLRIDYIHHSVMIPYRRQAADFIYGFAVILRVAFLYYEPQKFRTRKCAEFLLITSSLFTLHFSLNRRVRNLTSLTKL